MDSLRNEEEIEVFKIKILILFFQIIRIFIKERLIKCIGYEHIECIDKLKMIKCFKERSSFGVR